MAIKYDKMYKLIDSKGYSLNRLKVLGVITHDASRKLSKGESVNLYHLDAICNHFGVPIEDVVEITIDNPSE